MSKMKQAAVSLLLVLSLLAALMAPAGAAFWQKPDPLQFNDDGSFTILQISDTQDTQYPPPNVLTLIEKAMDESKPDLVIFTGDQLKNYDSDFDGGNLKNKVQQAIDAIVRPVERRGIPFAVVYGNHDDAIGVSKEDQLKMYQRHSLCLMRDDEPELSGCGNYNLPILSSDGQRTAFNLYFIDSLGGGGSYYDYVKQDQIDWYVRTSNALKAANGGVPVPSMEFQHIPLPELRTVASEGLIHTGENNEGVSGPYYNSGLFQAMVQQGDMIAAFCGHNHTNTYIGTLDGVDLGFTPGAGFNEYGAAKERGVRVIELHESDLSTYDTHLLTFIGLLGDNPITQLRYRLFTVGELDSNNTMDMVKTVLSEIVDAVLYLVKTSHGNPVTIVRELLQFFGADVGYIEGFFH